MKLAPIPYSESQIPIMSSLARAFPDSHLHSIDLPYRFSSWALDDPENVAMWYDDRGRLQAWGVMQASFWSIDNACHADAEHSLHRQILDWGIQRARLLSGTRYGRPAWFVNVFADRAERIRDLEEAGFACQAEVGEDSWSKVWMHLHRNRPAGSESITRSLEENLRDVEANGFILRPLAGESEVSAYVDLQRLVFGTENMTVEWRSRTLRHPQYIPNLDLVIEAPGGRLAAFCIAWLDKQRPTPAGQIEPLGVHPDFHRLGLGRAILAEGLRRLRQLGAEHIYVETDQQRNAALALYESAGFRTVREVMVYRIDVV